MAAKLHATRSADIDTRCVWDRSGETVELLLTEDPELSTVFDHADADLHTANRESTALRRVGVTTVSLNDLLVEHEVPERFDFLSIDTEGTELRILQALDMQRYRPTLVAVEHNGRAEQESAMDALMAANGYHRRMRHLSDWDAWYRDSHPTP